MRAEYAPYTLLFKNKAVTSRDTLTERHTYYIRVWDDAEEKFGIGECALFRGLGDDDRPDYEDILKETCRHISKATSIDEIDVPPLTSLRFGVETAIAGLVSGDPFHPYPSIWSEGRSEIAINGLIWMGSAEEMLSRIDEKLHNGFRCVKLKIGGIDFDEELRLLSYIRNRFTPDRLELRLDANGAFTPANAMSRLEKLSQYAIHSIEQPIRQQQWEEMARICRESPIPVALDEELIGCMDHRRKEDLLASIRPQYIILKPSLCGGFRSADEWIDVARKHDIGWWATSALESDIGLNAIAQWVSTKDTTMPQGLGTGKLYTNNIHSPLMQVRDVLRYNPEGKWILPQLQWRS